MRLIRKSKERPQSQPRSKQLPDFASWEESATGQFGAEELPRLRDESPDDLAEAIWVPGIYIQNGVIAELLMHGNPRKAAMVARRLVEAHPITEKSIREQFGDVTDTLLKADLLRLPSKPSEYSR